MSIDNSSYDYHGKHTFNTYSYTYRTAKECLYRAKKEPEGSYYLFLACLTFCSFTVEAYLNHLGEIEFDAWKSEDKITIDDKINLLKKFGIKVDKGSAHYQRLKSIYNFRNKIAHGKTKAVTYVAKNIKSIGEMHTPAEKKFWGITVDEKSCDKALIDLDVFVKAISKQAGIKGNPFDSLGGGIGTRKYNAKT